MTELYLVRHAETIWHGENRYAGRSDIPLSEHGQEQTLALAQWARDAHLDVIVSSPLRRTVETAQPAAAAAGLSLETDDRLRELAFGRAEGLTTSEMYAIFPRELDAFHRDPVNHHLPEGEHPKAGLARAMAAVDDLCARYPNGRVLVVGHTTIIRLVLCHLLGIDISGYRRIFPKIRNAGLTHVRITEGIASLVQLNADVVVPPVTARAVDVAAPLARMSQPAPAAAPAGDPATVLAAGDHFMLPALLRDSVRRVLGGHVETRELLLPWPREPFGDVAEVHEASGTEEQMIEALQGVSACVTQMAPLTERILSSCPDLELFCVGRGGPVNVDLAAATRHGVAVTYAPGRNAAATAEHTLALILAASRRIVELGVETAAGRWRGDYYAYENTGIEIDRTPVGLVGLGAIGRRVAVALRALGAEVLVHDPYVAADEVARVGTAVSLEDLLRRSRIVSLHARATPETDRLINAERLRLMPAGSVLVNCARGRLLDSEALCDALDSGHLSAAALDVYDREPIPPDSRLLRTPNLTLTPHVAGASRQVAEKAAEIVAGEVGRYLHGEPLRHCANPEVIAVPGVRPGAAAPTAAS